MGVSYFGYSVNEKPFNLSHHRKKRMGEGYLITTDFGAWAYLTEKEYGQLLEYKPEESTFNLLKQKGIILTEDNIEGMIHDSRRRYGFLFQGTSLHIVVPTLRCNIKCIYCHSRAESVKAKGFDMDKETAKKTVDFIFQSPSNCITIEFQGGEPLLRFDLVKYILEYSVELNKKYKKELNYNLVTNLTLMTDEIYDELKKYNRMGICTSLDGHKLLHNKNRQEYDMTEPWIKRINIERSLHAMPLITRNSLPYHKEIIDEYVRLGLKKIWLKPLNNLGFASYNWKKIGINAEEYLTFFKKALDYLVKINDRHIIKDQVTSIILKKILNKDSANFLDLQSPCGGAIGQLAYNYDGGVYTCDEGRFFKDIFKIGSVDDTYREILSSSGTCSIVKASLNDNPYCEQCVYKPYCGLCPVCSYGETGNIITKLPDRRCEIYMGIFDHVFEKLLFDSSYRRVFLEWNTNSERYK